MYEKLFTRNLPVLRETLLDGVLAGIGFFNRERLEMALSRRRDLISANDPATFFDLYAWEVWASRWSD
jgi:hypothetical protein